MTIYCIACISVGAIAQSNMRIGNLEISVKDIPCPQNETCLNPKTTYKSTFCGIGFILPNNGNGYFTTLGGSSINLDIGRMHRYQITPQFALGRTLQYSYYNYRSWNAASRSEFVDEVIGKDYDKHGIRKQVYRSHNIAASAFTRYYLVPVKKHLYIDLGVQGDFAFNKYFKIKTESEGKRKYRNDYAFNPFTASVTARIGWNRKNCSFKLDGKCWRCDNSRAIFVRYRFTDAFNSKALPMDLPRITIGIQFF